MGGIEKFGYSASGLVAYTNQIGNSSSYTLDALGRKTGETNADSQTIAYGYNSASDLLSLTDGKSQTTKWAYDSFGRVTAKTNQVGSVVLIYTYDAQDRLLSRWSAAKGTTYYTNDAVGNLTYIDYPHSTSVSLQYDWLKNIGVGSQQMTLRDLAGVMEQAAADQGEPLGQTAAAERNVRQNAGRNRKASVEC